MLLGLLFARTQKTSFPQRSTYSARYLVVIAAVVVMAVFSSDFGTPFIGDDYILTSMPHPDAKVVWGWLTHAQGDGAYRPLGNLYFSLIHMLAGTTPWKWHILSLSIHMLNCALLYLLTRNLWGNAIWALASAFFFAIHGTRAETVGWIAASFDLLACAFALGSFLIYLSAIRKTLRWTAALGLLVAAILCKESAYSYPLFVLTIAYAAKRVTRELWWFAIAAAAICGLLFAYRLGLFHGVGGYLDPSTGQPQLLSIKPVLAAKALLWRIWAILLFPVDWDAPMNPFTKLAIVSGFVAVLVFACFGAKLSRRILIGLLASVIAWVLPVLHLALLGESALGSRYYYLPAIGFCILMGYLITRASSQWMLVAAGILLLSMATITRHNLTAWHASAVLADRECAAIARGERVSPAATFEGVYHFKNGLAECVETKRESK